jgi:hypothetical protein
MMCIFVTLVVSFFNANRQARKIILNDTSIKKFKLMRKTKIVIGKQYFCHRWSRISKILLRPNKNKTAFSTPAAASLYFYFV